MHILIRVALAATLIAYSSAAEGAPFACPTLGFSMVGSAPLQRIASSWAESMAKVCHNSPSIDIIIPDIASGVGSSFAGVTGACAANPPVDIGMMSRPWLRNEATVRADGYTYDCLLGSNAHVVTQVAVAMDATAVFVNIDGVAKQCVDILGGLMTDQLRYIFSSHTYAQLQESKTWDETAVPNSYPQSDTKYWSDFSASCAREEIVTVGPGSNTGINEVFSKSIGIELGSGESLLGSIRWFVPPQTEHIVGYVEGDGMSIGYVENSFFSTEASSNLTTVAVKQGEQFVHPSFDTVKDSTYPMTNPVYMNVAQFSIAKTRSFFEYGFEESGSAQVKELGFVPLSSAKGLEMLSRLAVNSIPMCFPADAMVDVLGKGPSPIQHVAIGDMVKIGNAAFSEVYSFGHYDHDTKAAFLEISADGLHMPLVVSSDHLVFVENKPVPASTVTIGDKLTLVDGLATVNSIKTVIGTGAFAPFTKAGTIVVNNVVASSYITLQPDFASLVIGGVGTFDMHYLAHLFQAPHRVVCEVMATFCQEETYINGVSAWASGPLHVIRWLLRQKPVVMVIAFLPFFAFVLCAAAVEALLVHSSLVFVCITASFALRFATVKYVV